MPRFVLGAACALLVTIAVPGIASADILDTRVAATGTTERACHESVAAKGAEGVVQRTVAATANGLVRARLTGQGRGDWDVGVLDADTGRSVAGGTSFGMTELAEGVARKGQRLVVQACRVSGPTRSVDLRVSSIPLAPPTGERIQLVEVALPNEVAREALNTLDLDLTEHARPGIQDVVLYGADDAAKLRKAGLSYQVITPDMVAADRAALRARQAAGPTEVPSGRTEYRHLADYGSDMKKLVQENPNLVKPITLPLPSLEGRAVEGIEISNNVNLPDGKPVFLQLGVHHAREWPSGEMPLEWAFELVQAFKANDDRTKKLLDQTRVIVVPIVNPDGFNLSRESPVDSQQPVVDAGFSYKRKNCRVKDFAVPMPGECGQDENRELGTDPNRNYGSFWGGGGASTDVISEAYRGGGPFSEPETQNIKDLISKRQVVTMITNHTYSDLVLRPPGLRMEGDPPDEPVYKNLGDTMAAENGYTSQHGFDLYDTTGTTEDWSYYATGGLGFTFEIGRARQENTLAGVGFHPAYPVGVVVEYYGKEPGGGGNREAYYKALESTANVERHSIISGSAVPGATLRLKKTFTSYTSAVLSSGGIGPPQSFQDTLDATTTVPASGAFEIHANPSVRPYGLKARTFKSTAPQASRKADLEPSRPTVPGEDDDIPIEIAEGDAKAGIKVFLEIPDNSDYDISLLDPEGEEVASGTSGFLGEDELLLAQDLRTGTYTLRVNNFAGSEPWTGYYELYAPGPTVDVPASSEPWTLTCERTDGTVLGTRQVTVARGQRTDVGSVCSGGSGAGPGTTTGTLGVSFAVDRRRLGRALGRGLRARIRCTLACTASARVVVAAADARRLRLSRSRRAVTIGRGSAGRSAFTGRRTFSLRFTRSAIRRLRRARRLRFTVRATATAQGRSLTRSVRVTLNR